MTKLRELLSDKSKWTQMAFARDKNNQIVDVSSPEACQFCLVGGLNRLDISMKEWNVKYDKMIMHISELPDANRFLEIGIANNRPKAEYSLSRFNDSSSWETIDAMLNKLDI